MTIPKGELVSNIPKGELVSEIPTGELVGQTIGPVEGFWDNLRNPAKLMKEESLVSDVARLITGTTTKAKEQAKDKFRIDPQLQSIGEMMGELEARGQRDSKEYQALVERYDKLKGLDKVEHEMSAEALIGAFKKDPGMVAAEMVNALVADPELAFTPLGWEAAATRAVAATAKLGKASKAIGAAAGAGGAATVGGGIVAGMSAAEQLDQAGEVDWDRLSAEAKVGAALSVALIGGGKAAINLSRGARNVIANGIKREIGESVGAAQVHSVSPQTLIGDFAGSVSEKMNKIGKSWVFDQTVRKSISYLDDLAEISPTMKKLRNMMEYTEFSKTPIKASFFEAVDRAAGGFHRRLQTTMDEIVSGFRRRLSPEAAESLVKALRTGNFEGPFAKQARELRKLLDDVRAYANDAGLEVKELKNYFPRVYNPEAIEKNQRAFHKILTDHDIDSNRANQIIDDILDNDGVRVRKESNAVTDMSADAVVESFSRGVRKNPNLEKSRVLRDIPDEALAPFLENDPYQVLSKYISGAVRRAEYARRMGKGEGKLHAMLKQIHEEANAVGRKVTKNELNRVLNIAKGMQGTLGHEMDIGLRKFMNGVSRYELMRTLTFATITSLSEPALILARFGVVPSLYGAFKGIDAAARGSLRLFYRKLPLSEAEASIREIGIGLEAATMDRLSALASVDRSGKWTRRFFRLTMLDQFTRWSRLVAAEAAESYVKINLKKLAKAPNKEAQWGLAELGVDAAEGLAWLKRGAPKEDPFYEQIRLAKLRGANEVIMNPRVTNMPIWMSDPRFQLVSQLKKYMVVFTNTVMKRWYHVMKERDGLTGNGAKLSATVMALWGMAYANDLFREYVNYGPKGNPRLQKLDFPERMMVSLNRSPLLGVAQFGVDAVYAYKFGSAGVTQLMGPSFTQGEDVLSSVGALTEGEVDPLISATAEAIPGINATRGTREWAKERLKEVK